MSKIKAGIDIGSRTIAVVVLEDGKIVETRQTETGFAPVSNARKLLDGIRTERIVATGYGRNLFEQHFESGTITEIKAAAAGAFALFPGARVILDIGGQDVKVISMNEQGRVLKFEMNDRCAAGTGKFLEIMADSLGFPLGELGENALESEKEITISNVCTVFAESEVVSLLAKGEKPVDVAMGIHSSVAKRALSMIRRVTNSKQIFFSGGVARNKCIVSILEQNGYCVKTAENPQMVVAYGAALFA